MTHKITRRKMMQATAATGAGALVSGSWSWTAAWAAPGDSYVPHKGPLDTLIFGDTVSETAHSVSTTFSDSITGALNQSARIFTPASPATYFGGTASFTMAVAPMGTTYVTIKLWGSEKIASDGVDTRFLLFVEGKEVGWQTQSLLEPLDILQGDPRFAERFFFNTLPLPESLTAGKTSINLEIRAAGNFKGGANASSAYLDYTTGQTRGAYRLYTHTTPYFTLAKDDIQGQSPNAGIRPSPGAEVIDTIKKRVENNVSNYYSKTTSDLWAINVLAEAIITPGTIAYQNSAALDRIFMDLDAVWTLWTTNQSASAITQQQWQGLGRVGYTLALIWNQIGNRLDQHVASQTNVAPPVRRAAYSQILQESRDYWRQNMPHFTNQVMICAMGIYQANRGLLLLKSPDALPEPQARDYIYQAIGLKPFLGRIDANGDFTNMLGNSYYQISPQGLSRELGFVGTYGEILDWLSLIYDSVTRGYGAIQDDVLLEQMKLIAKGRAIFRYPSLDGDGYRCYRLEVDTGWRAGYAPGDIVYAQRQAWDGHALQLAAVVQDPEISGWAQKQLDDNQFYTQASWLASYASSRVGLNAQRLIYRDLAAFTAQSPTARSFPMDWDQSDFVFSDETNAMVAIKHGTDILYVNLYYRARQAVNNYARVHHITPTYEHSGTIREQSLVMSVGTWAVPDWIYWDWAVNDPANTGPGAGFPDGSERPDGYSDLHQAFAGEVLHLNHYPKDVPDPTLGVKVAGVETVFVGKADFYRCTYGPYLIACNTTKNQTFLLDHGEGDAIHVHTGKPQSAGQDLKVPAMTTIVLYRPEADWRPSKMLPAERQGEPELYWS